MGETKGNLDTKPDAATLKEDVPGGAVRSDTERPADANPEEVQISGARADRGGLPEPERAVENEDREGRRIGKTPT
jgi:hypothetical protein